MVSLILSVIKFASIFSTGVFGALGIVKDYKDKDNNVTRWGRIAIVGTMLSVFLAASIQGLELKRARDDAAATSEQNRKSIENLKSIGDTTSKISSEVTQTANTQEAIAHSLAATQEELAKTNKAQEKLFSQMKGIEAGVSKDLEATNVVSKNLQVALTNTERALDPIGDLVVSMHLNYFYLPDSRFTEYVKRLDSYVISKLGPGKHMEEFEIRDPSMKVALRRNTYRGLGTSENFEQLIIEPTSPLFPQRNDPKEKQAASAVGFIGPIFLSITKDATSRADRVIADYMVAAWNSDTENDFLGSFPPIGRGFAEEFALASAQAEAPQIKVVVDFVTRTIELRARPMVVRGNPILDLGNHPRTDRVVSIRDLNQRYLEILIGLNPGSTLPTLSYLRIGFNGGESRRLEFYDIKKSFTPLTPDFRQMRHQFNKAELNLN